MPDPNLTAALEGSLALVTENPDSPLTEATPDSIDILLDRINNAFAEGLPEKLTDETLRQVITAYRSQALRWTQEEEIKRAKGPRTKKAVPLGVAFDLGELDDLDLGK